MVFFVHAKHFPIKSGKRINGRASQQTNENFDFYQFLA